MPELMNGLTADQVCGRTDMKIAPITVIDKKGRTIELRAAEQKDASALIAYLKVTSGETSYLIREPD